MCRGRQNICMLQTKPAFNSGSLVNFSLTENSGNFLHSDANYPPTAVLELTIVIYVSDLITYFLYGTGNFRHFSVVGRILQIKIKNSQCSAIKT